MISLPLLAPVATAGPYIPPMSQVALQNRGISNALRNGASVPRGPDEFTCLMLGRTREAEGHALGLCVVAPDAITTKDFDVYSWWPDCRLVRVEVDSSIMFAHQMTSWGDLRALYTEFCSRLTPIASLECSDGTTRVPVRVVQSPLFKSTGPTVLLEMPLPDNAIMRPGAVIWLTVSISGSSITYRIPPSWHIHTDKCNHNRKMGDGALQQLIWECNYYGLKSALDAGRSTEETFFVGLAWDTTTIPCVHSPPLLLIF